MRWPIVILVVTALTLSAVDPDVAFHRSKITDAAGKDLKVDLIFEHARETIAVRRNKTLIALIPYTAIDRLSYSYSKHRRIRPAFEGEGFEIKTGCSDIDCLVPFPSGIVPPFTKDRSHWFYIDYTDGNGPGEFILRLDKSEFQKILDAARLHTGKEVVILNELCVGNEVKLRC